MQEWYTMFADMHIHSTFSDGTFSPAEIIMQAKAKEVSLLCIADHNCIDAYETLIPLCSANGVQCISAVELDCVHDSVVYHVLAYGFDLADKAFRSFIVENSDKLEQMSIGLIKKMSIDYPVLTLQDYNTYQYNRTRGGWKGINYLLDKGFTSTLKDGLRFYSQYQCNYIDCGFPTVAQTCEQIKSAGGLPVLAHPCDKIALDDQFEEKLNLLCEQGIEGFECYYPLQDHSYTKACLDFCTLHGLAVTCGSDSHGAFTPELSIGVPEVSRDKLNLKHLL
jgi:3',5'-nucleoside bisphosphate phosphatase